MGHCPLDYNASPWGHFEFRVNCISWDIIKQTKIHIMGIKEGEVREEKHYFKE